MEQLVELARGRKLDRVGATYAVVAWIAVQAASIALPAFEAPPWVLRGLIVAAMAGFPLVLALAWVASGRTPPAAPLRRFDRKDWLLIGLIGLVAVLLIAQLALNFAWRRSSAHSEIAAPSVAASSIAVLPFANLSGDPKKAYFSDGIADQLIGELSQIPSLRVAARTSSFSFRGKNVGIKKIAQALGVRTVLEGSVREEGRRARITAELVDAQTGFQMWARSYDRDLSDILAVQDSITHEIASALSSRLLGKTATVAPATAQTIDPEVYRLFLQGRFFAARDTEADYRRAADLFAQVTAHASHYADGFAGYANALVALASDYGDSAALAPAEEAARHALALDGRNLLALRTLMAVSIAKWDWLAAADWLSRAYAIAPNSASVLHSRSVLAATMHFPRQDFGAEKKAADLDPLSFVEHYNLAIWYFQQGRYDEAATAQQGALLLQPANTAGRDSLCSIQVARRKLAEARQIVDNLATMYVANPEWRIGCPLDLALAEGRKADARKFADEAAAAYSPSNGGATEIGSAYRSVGDLDRAMVWYERAYAARERDLLQTPEDRLQTGTLLADSRWKALWARQPIRDWEAARQEMAGQFQAGE